MNGIMSVVNTAISTAAKIGTKEGKHFSDLLTKISGLCIDIYSDIRIS